MFPKIVKKRELTMKKGECRITVAAREREYVGKKVIQPSF
jgi:hypothetical protein